MATVKAIKYGMKGNDVSSLQTSLKNAGYDIDVDGSFGPQTLAAVKQYQKANGLTVDGMVGPQTQAALSSNTGKTSASKAQTTASAKPAASNQNKQGTSSATAAQNTSSPAQAPVAGTPNVLDTPTDSGPAPVNYPGAFSYSDFSYADYAESETVMQAQAALDAALAAQPGAYQSKWQGQINEILDRILNREEFSYDVNEDALYQQYADQYQRGGKMAMMDAMGQAAAMTGGYGNSYAATVGNQAYQAYLAQLNDVVPELYGMALDRYNAEGQEMYNQYGLLSDQEAQDYGRHQDEYNKWRAEVDYATGRYDSERDYDYGKYVDDRNYQYGVYSDNRNQAYNEYLSEIQKAQWGAQYSEDVRQSNINNSYRETVRQDGLNSEAKAYARDDVLAVIQSGGTPTDEQLAAAGMSKETATALVTAYQKAGSVGVGSGGGSGSGKSEEGSSYVTDSGKIADWSEAILEANTEEEALRYVERLEQLDPALADSLYEEWLKEHGSGHVITDTTVAAPQKGSLSGSGGGVGGQIRYKY
jgi:peptidoglycan hydrolase-like protein with peptidoglycan-binding domain